MRTVLVGAAVLLGSAWAGTFVLVFVAWWYAHGVQAPRMYRDDIDAEFLAAEAHAEFGRLLAGTDLPALLLALQAQAQLRSLEGPVPRV